MDSVLPSINFVSTQETSTPKPFSEAHSTFIYTIRAAPVMMFLLYAFILLSYASRSFRTYRKGNRDTIIIHALSGISELSQFYLPSTSPSANVPFSALFLCCIQSATNMILVRKLGRGNPALVRPVYQAGAFFRVALMLAAYLFNSQSLYHDSVVIIHAFAYTRLICFLFTTSSGFSDTEVPEYDAPARAASEKTSITFAQTYTAAVYGSALIVMGQMETAVLQKFAAAAFLVAVGAVMRLENWVSEEMTKIAQKGLEKKTTQDRTVCGLYTLGFCRLSVLLEMDRKLKA